MWSISCLSAVDLDLSSVPCIRIQYISDLVAGSAQGAEAPKRQSNGLDRAWCPGHFRPSSGCASSIMLTRSGPTFPMARKGVGDRFTKPPRDSGLLSKKIECRYSEIFGSRVPFRKACFIGSTSEVVRTPICRHITGIPSRHPMCFQQDL